MLTQRRKDKYNGGMWEPTGGLVTTGETSIEAIKREVFEDNSSINKEFSGQEIPESINSLYNFIKEIIRNSGTIDLEKMLIQISMYYILATSNADDMIELTDCSNILEQELKNESKTLF